MPSKPPHSDGRLVERRLAVVPEGRVAEVVREAGGVDHVGVGAEPAGELPADLGALQRVGQPGARNPVLGLLVDLDHLGLGRRAGAAPPNAAPEPGRARTGCGSPASPSRLSNPALAADQRVSLPAERSSTVARPASSRATGTRNGEQDT